MDSLRMTTQRPYNGDSRVDPNYPLPSSLPPQDTDSSHLTNGLGRTTSRRRRASGSGPAVRSPVNSPSLPPAPEVPKAPPISYRLPYNPDSNYPPTGNYPSPSFAERARALTGNTIITPSPDSDHDPVPQPVKPVRRGSLNRPIGGVYSEIQQHKRDSYPPPSGPISPRRFSNPTTTVPQQPHPSSPQNQNLNAAPSQQRRRESSRIQPDHQRPPVNPAQTTKEWAPDRSPLQKLEIKLSDISKEEKRARVQEAEQRLRVSKGAERSRNSDKEANSLLGRTSSNRASAIPGERQEKRSSRLHDSTPMMSNAAPGLASDHASPSPQSQISRSEGSRPHKRQESVPTDLYRETPGRIMPGPNHPSNLDERQRKSTRRKQTSQYNQRPDRGVRFEDHDGARDLDSDPSNIDWSYTTKSRPDPGIGSATKSDSVRDGQRGGSRRNLPSSPHRSLGRDVPEQQRDLYDSRAEKDAGAASAVTYGGTADPVPRIAVQGRGHTSNYEVPPQTSAGIRARQAVGFDTKLQGATEAPAHYRHHLSDILHRGHNHALQSNEEAGTKPRQLDEWRRAGTARLTAADFGPPDEPKQDELAWWERSGSGKRRKAARATNREAQSLQGGIPGISGKSKSHSSHQRSPDGEVEDHQDTPHGPRTRQYVGEDEYTRLRDDSHQLHRSHLAHLLHLSGHEDVRGLSSVYSYSCPNLAIHDPSHPEHICEPYLSKELTQSMRSIRIRAAPELTTFDPPLYLRSGPLLRYTGLKRDRREMKARSGGMASVERETWRGTVMIVTADADSSYDPVPTLRLFSEPMDILPPPPNQGDASTGQDLPAEYLDPIAGLPKLSRSGKTVYVKPVDDLDHAKDLSRVENDEGLFEETRTAAVPTAYGTPGYRASPGNPKPVRREGRKGQLVNGVRLHAERGVTFWRFNLEVELGAEQNRIAYSINNSPSVGFWVPARGHSMNVMFHSCNGFSMSVNPDDFSGPDPLWRDVLNSHQTRPFHVMIGGGDQIYNDAVMSQCPLFREWLEIKNPHHKHDADFTRSLREELETFYLERYCMWFSQGLFGMANSQIPMVNMWDDHDIIDGFGSYPHHFMSTPVFCGIGAVAFKYYMLFQHQSVPDESSADEPSWLMGASPGPYINELSRSIFMSLGKNIAFLAVDCRTERMREQVLSEASYDLVFDRCRREILEGETKHLIVLLGIPVAYPRLVWLENLLTSRVMDPVKYLGKAGMLGGFLNKFDGGVEILDDLDDHWTAKNHKLERNWFIQELQELAAEKSVRVTMLGGDVHLAAVGQFFSNPKLRIPKDKDHRYMANIISSAIVNTPPPNNMADILNKRNKTHHLDPETDEDMIPMFTHDVNGTSRNNKHLLPRRNWCSIREYHPGTTPPSTPPLSEPESESDVSPPPPTRLQRTLSLTRGDMGPGKLLRRLSGRGPPPLEDYPAGNRYDSGEPSSPDLPENDGYFPRQSSIPKRAATVGGNGMVGRRHSSLPPSYSSGPLPRPGNFHRRPTNMSEKAALRGDPDDTSGGHINLEHGLDIVLNCEVNQKDPAGITVPYRLLLPALFYEGHGDENTAPFRKKSLVSRLTSLTARRRNTLAGTQGQGNWGQAESVTPSESEGEEESAQPRPRRWSFGITQRRQYRDQTPPRQNGEEREIGDEGTQKGRQFEHRSQQIGQSQQPFSMPPRQQRLYGETDPQSPPDHHGVERGDSVDYHQHLDHSPPNESNGYPGRRPSKVDRMLGVANLQRNPSTGGVSKIQRSSSAGNGRLSFGRGEDNAESPERLSYESEEYNDDGDDDDDIDGHEAQEPARNAGGQRISQGYGGIEAYSEKKGWRKWLDKAKEWEEKSSGRPKSKVAD